MHKLSLISIILLSFNLEIDSKQISSRIIGGNDARVSQFPYAAAIHVSTPTSQFFCSGALISAQWVITAGSCAQNANSFRIELGTPYRTKSDPNRIVLSSTKAIQHPDFKPDTLENDIALIELRQPVTYSAYVQPINARSLPVLNYTSAIAIGWGLTSDANGNYAEDLQYVELAALPNEECKLVFGDQISDNMACLGGNDNEGLCVGDSGSPLIEEIGRNVWLIGVGSFYSGNGCESTDPSGFTRIHPYTDWIFSYVDA